MLGCHPEPLATKVPKEVWIEGLAAVEPRFSPAYDPLAHMAWLRSLASLAASCKFFRRLLWSPEADKLYDGAAAAPHFHWRTWRPFGAQGCTALARTLQRKAHILCELHLDCTAVEAGTLRALLLGCVQLKRLSLVAVTPAAAASLSLAFSLGLEDLSRLDCPGPDSHMPFAALPPSLTCLSCRISNVEVCHQDSFAAFGSSLAWLPSLLELHLHLEGPDASFHIPASQGGPYLSAACRGLLSLLRAFHLRAAPLQQLFITQRLPASAWQARCVRGVDAANPLIDPADPFSRWLVLMSLGVQLADLLEHFLSMWTDALPQLQALHVRFSLEASCSDSNPASSCGDSDADAEWSGEVHSLTRCMVVGSGEDRGVEVHSDTEDED